jgi:hypothetical protein
VLLENAAVHPEEHAGPAGLPGQPFRESRPLASRSPEPSAEWPDPTRSSTNSEDVRDVELLRIETRHNLSRPNRIDLRVRRNDAVSPALPLGRDAMAETRKAPESDHDNGSLRSSVTGIGRRERNHAFLFYFYFYFFAESSFCLYIFKASLRTVSEISLLPETFFKSRGCKCFINPNPRSSGVRGFDTRFRTTM